MLGDVWMKAKLFDAQLEKGGHVSGSKMVGFLVSQVAKMEGLLETMRTFIQTTREIPKPLGEDSSSSDYSGLIPHDLRELRGTASEWEDSSMWARQDLSVVEGQGEERGIPPPITDFTRTRSKKRICFP